MKVWKSNNGFCKEFCNGIDIIVRLKEIYAKYLADMAQEVEHVLGKDEVTGSNPVISSTDPVQFVNGIFFLPLPKFLTGIKKLQKTPVRCPTAV